MLEQPIRDRRAERHAATRSEILDAAWEVARAAARIREAGVYKPPGVAESIDWATAVATLGRDELDPDTASATLGTVLKYREDQARIRMLGLEELVGD